MVAQYDAATLAREVLVLAAASVHPKLMGMSHKPYVRRLLSRIEKEGPRIGTDELLRADGRTLCRFLRARKWDEDAAYKMFAAAVAWRRENDIDRFRRESVGPFGGAALRYAQRRGYRSKAGVEAHPESRIVSRDIYEGEFRTFCGAGCFGVDYQNRPVYIERTGETSPFVTTMCKHLTRDAIINRHIRQMELALARMDEIEDETGMAPDGQVVILDMTNITISLSADAMYCFKTVSQIDSDYYPETLARQYMVNVPGAFVILWKLITAFVDEKTVAKIQILRGSEMHRTLDWIPANQIPREYGGTLDIELEPVRWAVEYRKNKKSDVESMISRGKEIGKALEEKADRLKAEFETLKAKKEAADIPASGTANNVLQLEQEFSPLRSEDNADDWFGGAAGEILYTGGTKLWRLSTIWILLMCGMGALAVWPGLILEDGSGDGPAESNWFALALCSATALSLLLSAVLAARVSSDIHEVCHRMREGTDTVASTLQEHVLTGNTEPVRIGEPAFSRPFRKLQAAVATLLAEEKKKLAKDIRADQCRSREAARDGNLIRALSPEAFSPKIAPEPLSPGP